MKNLLIKIVLWGLLILFPTLCLGWEETDRVEYRGFTGEEITMAWDASEGAMSYTVEGWNSDRQAVIMTGTTSSLQITFTIPASGHYIFRVKACNDVGCSEEARSNDPAYATVNGEPRAWVVYSHLAPPGPVSTE